MLWFKIKLACVPRADKVLKHSIDEWLVSPSVMLPRRIRGTLD
jgi:hypothetical protein